MQQVSGTRRWMSLGLIGTAMAFGLGGCYSDGGNMYSMDQHVYVSRPYQPMTVTLRDTRTGQEFWSTDVPVGKKLVVRFADSGGTKDLYTPALMHWALMAEDGDIVSSRLSNSLPVPPSDARRLEPMLRTGPELPESMVQATKGTLKAKEVQVVRPPTVTVPVPPPQPVDEPLDIPARPETQP